MYIKLCDVQHGVYNEEMHIHISFGIYFIYILLLYYAALHLNEHKSILVSITL